MAEWIDVLRGDDSWEETTVRWQMVVPIPPVALPGFGVRTEDGHEIGVKVVGMDSPPLTQPGRGSGAEPWLKFENDYIAFKACNAFYCRFHRFSKRCEL